MLSKYCGAQRGGQQGFGAGAQHDGGGQHGVGQQRGFGGQLGSQHESLLQQQLVKERAKAAIKTNFNACFIQYSCWFFRFKRIKSSCTSVSLVPL